ncbi:MAG: nuclear transport factor 2 family protein [Bacteroidota bacterium]
MTVQQIADRLVELCRTGQHSQCYTELFAEAADSYEMPGLPNAHTKGREALLAKGAAWAANVQEIHKMEVTDPLVYGNLFTIGMGIDLTKKDGTREAADELCVYEVKDGKIVSERFIYSM